MQYLQQSYSRISAHILGWKKLNSLKRDLHSHYAGKVFRLTTKCDLKMIGCFWMNNWVQESSRRYLFLRISNGENQAFLFRLGCIPCFANYKELYRNLFCMVLDFELTAGFKCYSHLFHGILLIHVSC